DRKVRALSSAPGHVCFSLTEDLHGCRTAVVRAVLSIRFDLCTGTVRSQPYCDRSKKRDELREAVAMARYGTMYVGTNLGAIDEVSACPPVSSYGSSF